MTAQERLQIALNILARVGIDGDLQGEYAKAIAGVNQFDSMQAMQSQIPPPTDMMGQGQTPTPLGEEQTPPML